MNFSHLITASLLLAATVSVPRAAQAAPAHTFAIGDKDFLLDGKPLQIRCGEIHFARVPRALWRDRLKRCRAMGLNTVCAYLFWNYHEFQPGKYTWTGQADAAEFCRIAQQEGLYVILRPGPYACAEWDGGGLPWWLLKNPTIKMRSQDPAFMSAGRAWLKEVGRVLGPQQVSHGGPILMVQVENEYGSYGSDAEYMGQLRQATLDGGFDVPLFACNPTGDLQKGFRPDLFQVVNFGNNPEGGFRALRAVQPSGPLMCGEFYSGWFDTWGAPHHTGNTQGYLRDLETMLKMGASFSIYMAHGGTSPGLWPGADRPFKPDSNSYDYDAPISENGDLTEKFQQTRALMSKYLMPGETLPQPPKNVPVMSLPAFSLSEKIALEAALPAPLTDAAPRSMEMLDQGHGCILYRTTLPAGPATTLQADAIHDFAWVSLNGVPLGEMDRRTRRPSVAIPARTAPMRLDILVEAMGHVNFGQEVHDRKGILGNVSLTGTSPTTLANWQVFSLPLDDAMLRKLKWKPMPGAKAPNGAKNPSATMISSPDAPRTMAPSGGTQGAAFYRGFFSVAQPTDTFLDMRSLGKGVIWINGHCLSRFWNVGPTQTAYLPATYLRAGRNEVVVFDLVGPSKMTLAGLDKPILDNLRPELDFNYKPVVKGQLKIAGMAPALRASFPEGAAVQEVRFPQAIEGRQFVIEALSSQDGQPYTTIAELDLLDANGQSIPHTNWSIPYVDSEELDGEDGSASNALDGQTNSFWHTQWSAAQPKLPHQLAIDLGTATKIGGFRYTPRAGTGVAGRIKDYQVFIGSELAIAAAK